MEPSGARRGVQASALAVVRGPEPRVALPHERDGTFRAIFELTSMGAALTDPATARFRLVNDALCRITGYSRDELLAMSSLQLSHPDDREMTAARYVALAAGGVTSYRVEKRYVRRDGSTIWVQADVALLRDAAARPLHSLAIMQDITDRKRAETALRESEQRYRGVVEAQTELICRYLPDTTLTWMNEAYCRYFGRTREALHGTKFLALVPESERAAVRRRLAILMETGTCRPHEHRVYRADGSLGWQQWSDHVIRGDDGRIVELQGLGRDITERKRAERALLRRGAALRRSHHQIRALAARLLTAGEEERRRLARELHDDVNQRLAALAIALGTARRRRVDAPAALVNELGDLEASALELADDLRQLSHDLHPAILEHAGLAAALRAHCSEVARVAGLSVAVTVDGIRSVELDAALCLCLYRVAQEALRNVVKHAGAGRVEVSVVATGGAAALVVSDDGRGFEPAHAPRSGLGLVSMAERVRLIRGTLAIESAPGRGTQVRARVPIAPVG